MSIDRSLKSRNALSRHRNVLKRSERLEILEDDGKWSEEQDELLGLPKVSHRKSATGKKTKKEKDETETTTEEAAAATETPQE